MSEEKNAGTPMSDEEVQDLVASTDTGGRQPTNRNILLFLASVAFIWSVFQVWIA